MTIETRFDNNGNIEIKHPELEGWMPVVSLLRILNGYDVRLIDSQSQILDSISENIELIASANPNLDLALSNIATALSELADSSNLNIEEILASLANNSAPTPAANSGSNITVVQQAGSLIKENVLIRIISLLADEEKAYALPDWTTALSFSIKKNIDQVGLLDLQYAFKPGQVNLEDGEFRTILANKEYNKSGLLLFGKTLYLTCNQPVKVEIEISYKMPNNTNIYPDDFANENVVSDALTLENAITFIQVQARNTSRRLANSRRISGQNEIANLQRATKINFGYLSLKSVGQQQDDSIDTPDTPVISPSFLGTVSYFQSIDHGLERFNFANEGFSPSGLKLKDRPISEFAGAGNAESGKFCGGRYYYSLSWLRSIEKIVYATEIVSRINAELSHGVSNMTGGMGNSEKSILTGGSYFVYGVGFFPSNMASTLNNITEALTFQNTFLTSFRINPPNGLSSSTAGYIWAGTTLGHDSYYGSYTMVSFIDEIVYSTGTWIPTQISNTPPHTHINHGAFGNAVNGYVVGGVSRDFSRRDITRFKYSDQSISLLGTKISAPITEIGSTGCSTSGYIVASMQGGLSTSLTQKFRYDTETTSLAGGILGTTLLTQAGSCDYSAGWSNV